MKHLFFILTLLALVACNSEKSNSEVTLDYAKELSKKFILVDTHVDIPYRLHHKYADISQRTEDGHTDYVRFKEGGVNAPFMSIYISAAYAGTGNAKILADSLIDMVYGFETKWPDKFKVATSVSQVKENFNKGLISLPMGIENGTAIEDDLNNLKHFYDRGVRYMTLTHSKNNLIGGSATETEQARDGLTDFGKQVIEEMNRLGIMVDVSHVSDSTFWDVLQISKTPPIASHSACRHFTPGMERNMNDEMIKALAEKGGVIMISFGSYFLNDEYRTKMETAWNYIDEHNLEGEESSKYVENFKKENNVPIVQLSELVAHIKHAIDVAGVDHVGFGSDFEGVSDLPVGLSDASMYPNLIYELLKAGFTEKEIEKMCSGNIFRVWQAVEDYASSVKS